MSDPNRGPGPASAPLPEVDEVVTSLSTTTEWTQSTSTSPHSEMVKMETEQSPSDMANQSDGNTSTEGSPTKGTGQSGSKDRKSSESQDNAAESGGDVAMNREEEAANQAKSKREKQEEERLKMQVLVSNFSEGQLNRYEMFRRAAFPKASIKRLMQSIAGSSLSQNVVIAMSGISKVFVGEVVEEALDVKEQFGDTGPLQPKHLREAVRRMKHRNAIPNTKYTNKLFR